MNTSTTNISMNESVNSNDNKVVNAFYVVPKILLDLSFVAFGVFFALSTGVPIFIVGGIVLTLASALYTAVDVYQLFPSIKDNKKEVLFNRLMVAANILLALGLLGFGILAFATPALLGMTGLSLVFKICSLVAGAAFAAKALINFLGYEGRKASSPNVFIYGTGLALGISVLVLNGAFAVIPVVFTLVFALRTVASVLDIFGKNDSTKGVGRVARLIKTISFVISALALGTAAIFFAPAVASSLYVPALFVQIAGITGLAVCLVATLGKMLIGKNSSTDANMSLNENNNNNSSNEKKFDFQKQSELQPKFLPIWKVFSNSKV